MRIHAYSCVLRKDYSWVFSCVFMRISCVFAAYFMRIHAYFMRICKYAWIRMNTHEIRTKYARIRMIQLTVVMRIWCVFRLKYAEYAKYAWNTHEKLAWNTHDSADCCDAYFMRILVRTKYAANTHEYAWNTHLSVGPLAPGPTGAVGPVGPGSSARARRQPGPAGLSVAMRISIQLGVAMRIPRCKSTWKWVRRYPWGLETAGSVVVDLVHIHCQAAFFVLAQGVLLWEGCRLCFKREERNVKVRKQFSFKLVHLKPTKRDPSSFDLLISRERKIPSDGRVACKVCNRGDDFFISQRFPIFFVYLLSEAMIARQSTPIMRKNQPGWTLWGGWVSQKDLSYHKTFTSRNTYNSALLSALTQSRPFSLKIFGVRASFYWGHFIHCTRQFHFCMLVDGNSVNLSFESLNNRVGMRLTKSWPLLGVVHL